MIALSARYGLTSRAREPQLEPLGRPWPTTRSEHVRLSLPQATAVGANEPSTKRLYEFTFGA